MNLKTSELCELTSKYKRPFTLLIMCIIHQLKDKIKTLDVNKFWFLDLLIKQTKNVKTKNKSSNLKLKGSMPYIKLLGYSQIANHTKTTPTSGFLIVL